MDATTLTWLFLAGGLLLMILEAALPGGVAFFLGIGGLITGTLRVLGVLTDPVTSVFLWLVISTGFVLALRPVLMRHFGGSSSTRLADEDYEAMDRVVDVVEPVTDHDDSGRIRFRGANWAARSREGRLPAGSKAQIKYRDNLTWIVEPAPGYVPEYDDRALDSSDRTGDAET